MEKTQELEVLTIERKLSTQGENPISLPGDSLKNNEQVLSAAKRVLGTQTGLSTPLYRFKSFEDPNRLNDSSLDGTRVISKGYLGFAGNQKLQFGDLAANGSFVSINKLPKEMLYDHRAIFDSALAALKKAAEAHLIPLDGMPESFTISDIQHFYELVLEKRLDKRNFRRSILSKSYLEETGEYLRGTNFRPAKLYRFNRVQFQNYLDRELDKLPVILF